MSHVSAANTTQGPEGEIVIAVHTMESCDRLDKE